MPKRTFYRLTYKDKPYGRTYPSIDEVIGAHKRMSKQLEGIGWKKVRA